ncbi:MAG: TIGR04372 family glycosyltransferase [Gammaproteobacteria bacterium]|nr:TIGR04372 family glycosyltransferase [Gammaproteobacteria bacterium]
MAKKKTAKKNSKRGDEMAIRYDRGDVKQTTTGFRDPRHHICQKQIPIPKAITDAGGWVMRMGDSTMKPLPTMPQVIDYANSDMKSDWMDVFLCAQCRFVIGTSSGLFTLN